jgi:hypothetical protein
VRLVVVAVWVALSIVPLGRARAGESDSVRLTAKEVRERWHSRLDRRQFTARVRLSMVLAGMHEERELVVWRADGGGKSERVMIRFEAPPTMHNVGILFLKQVDRPNDYFLYQPELRRVRRLPEAAADDDVYGIDPEFLGFGVVQSEPTEVEGMQQETFEGRSAYRLEERALRSNPRFEERTTWLDAGTFIPVRSEYRMGGKTRMIARTVSTEVIQGVATPVRIEFENSRHEFENSRDERRVTLTIESTDYERPIPDEYFSTLALVRAKLTSESRASAR